jgi:hypothetical protein
MAFSNNDSVQDEPSPPEFINLALDMSLEEDELFRAGYPYPPMSPINLDGKTILILKTIYFIFSLL